MKKISELKETKELFKTERDENGNKIKVPYEKTVTYNVNVISGWARFGHYLIDGVCIYAIAFTLGILLAVVNPDFVLSMNGLEERIYGMLIVALYYFVSEVTTQRTIGKLATSSLVVDEYGNKPSASTILGRSFARIVPFEAFSCFSERGWHDTWTKTYVVSKAELEKIKRMQQADGVFVSDSADILD
jgi:uncharacterized RDD family membrane protein YckC